MTDPGPKLLLQRVPDPDQHDEPKSPFDSIQTSYQYLEKLRF